MNAKDEIKLNEERKEFLAVDFCIEVTVDI